MADSFPITCGGVDCSLVTLSVPSVGPWFADCTLISSDIAPAGTVQLVIGDVTLTGTVEPAHSGNFGERRVVRVVAGGGGWGKQIAARAYSNDAGVKAQRIASDAADMAGERLAATITGSFGAHYVRDAGTASRALEEVAQGVPWWVDFAGLTQVGKRFAVPAGSGARVLDYEPGRQEVTLAIDSLNDVPIGAQLNDGDAARWEGTLTVAAIEVKITAASLRVSAWCGAGGDLLVDTMRQLVARVMPQGLFGSYRYRVVQMNGDRVDLQAVKKGSLPDLVTVDMWPGVSGTHAKLAAGTHCVVVFLDGDRNDPIITNFVGRAGPGEIPDDLTIGPEATANGAARQNDTVTMMWPPMAIIGTAIIGGVPSQITGVVTALAGQTLGTITTGSAKVNIG